MKKVAGDFGCAAESWRVVFRKKILFALRAMKFNVRVAMENAVLFAASC